MDSISDALWETEMDGHVRSGVVIDSGTDYQMVLPVMETWPAGLYWFTVGDRMMPEKRDSLIVRGSTIFGFRIVGGDTVSVVPTTAEYQIVNWNKETRKKVKNTLPLAIGKRDAFFVALYSRQGWMESSKRAAKVKERQARINAERKAR